MTTTQVNVVMADAIVVGPDDQLVVYVKSLMDVEQIEMFRGDLAQHFGDRVFVISTDEPSTEVSFATIKKGKS